MMIVLVCCIVDVVVVLAVVISMPVVAPESMIRVCFEASTTATSPTFGQFSHDSVDRSPTEAGYGYILDKVLYYIVIDHDFDDEVVAVFQE